MSAVHKYYRKIYENVDNIKNSIDIASLLVKSQEVDSKIDNNESNISDNLTKIDNNGSNISSNLTKINTNVNDISSNLTKIGNNESNISSNLTKINTNVNDISSNLTKIGNNESNISSNLTKINTNVNDISSNTSLIDTNKNNISSNTSLIDTNKNNISSNTSLIDTNKNNISSNTSLIDTNKNNISSNTSLINTNKNNISDNSSLINTNKTNIAYNLNTLNNIDNDLVNLRSRVNNHQNDIQSINGKIFKLDDCYKLKDIIIIDIIKSQIAETIDSNNEFVIINSSLNNIKKDSYIQFDSSISIFFHKHYINIAFFHILLEYFNDKKVLIESVKMPIVGMISKHSNITNSCIIKVPNDFDKIYYKLSIKLNEGQNRSDLVSILDFDNKIYFKYFEK